MILIVMKIFSAIIVRVKEECSMLLTNYKYLKSMENEKLMKPTIRRAFYCMKLHLIITSLIFGLYDLAFSSFQDFAVTLAPLIIMVSFLILIFKYANSWLENALSQNRIILATNVFFVANFYVVIIIMCMYTFAKGYTEMDKIICMITSFIWIVYSFNLVPGMLSVKLSLYLIITIILFLLARPKTGYGFVTIICHVTAYIVQIYIMWQKYHEDCQILNKVEYEKNMNKFLQNNFPESIFTLNNDLEIINSNEKASNLLKANFKSSFKEFAELLINEKNQNLYTDLMKQKQIENIPYSRELDEKKGYLKLIASSSCFDLEGKTIIVVIIKDLTEFFRTQEKNLIERCQNILLFSAPHEVRSQLNLISGNLEQLEKSFDVFLLKLAKYAAKVMEYKLNLLFDFASIITGKFGENMKQFNFKTLVDEASEILKVFSKAKNLKLIVNYKSTSSILKCDYERFLSIIIHCGLNAIKYTKEGFIKLNIKFKNGFLHGKIIDTGIGIKGSIVDHINNYSLNPFSESTNMLKNSINTLENSRFLTGIGTLSSSFICKKLGGSLFIHSEENQGTEVFFKIQCMSAEDFVGVVDDESCILDSQRSTAEAQLSKYKFDSHLDPSYIIQQTIRKDAKFKIIVVDDQSFNRMTIINMLKALQFEDISEAENGQIAVELVQSLVDKYDSISIFMDIDMPIMNGILATSKIKQNDTKGKIRIVMLSAFNSQDLIEDSMKAGAEGYYVKPISFKKLKELKESRFLIN